MVIARCSVFEPPKAALAKRVELLAEEVGLTKVIHHRPDELSGGQRQRVAIARALVTQPEIVLADEPTANLDSVTSEQILGLMERLNQTRGVTFLFSTHDPRIMKRAKRVVLMADGKLVDGTAAAAQETHGMSGLDHS
jgi:putative ABC transport system ATP-binding protein